MARHAGSGLFRKVLFLEIAGFLSLAITVAVVFTVVAMHNTDLGIMVFPFAGLALTVGFVILTISYMRRDLHKIHELHHRPVYKLGQYVVYAVGTALVIFALYLFFTKEDFWSDISVVVVSLTSIIVAVFAVYYTVTLGYLIEHEHLRHSGISFFDLFILVLLPVGLVVSSVMVMFSQKATTVTEGKADFEISSSALIAEFEANAAVAKAKYVGKSVKFAGRVAEVAGDSSVLLKLATGVEEFTANCGFDKSVFSEVSMIKTGDSVSLQCSCSGVTKPEGEMDLLSEKSLDMVRCKLLTRNGAKI